MTTATRIIISALLLSQANMELTTIVPTDMREEPVTNDNPTIGVDDNRRPTTTQPETTMGQEETTAEPPTNISDEAKTQNFLWKVSEITTDDEILGIPASESTSIKSLKSFQMAQFGILVSHHENVMTTTKYGVLHIPFHLETYKEQIKTISGIFTNTYNHIEELQIQYQGNQNERAFSKLSRTEMFQFCTEIKESNLNSVKTRQECRKFIVRKYLEKLSARTLELLNDAQYRLKQINHDIYTLEKWFSPQASRVRREAPDLSETTDIIDEPNFHPFSTAIGSTLQLATSQELREQTKAITLVRLSTVKLIKAANVTRAILNIQGAQITELNSQIHILQENAANMSQLLVIQMENTEILSAALLNTIDLTAMTQIFSKANAVLSDIKIQLADMETYLETALRGKLSVKLIPPPEIEQIIGSFKTNLPNSQSLLWNINPSNAISYMEQFKATLTTGLKDAAAIISLQIPITDTDHSYRHIQISRLPFVSFENQSSYEMNMHGLENDIHLIIPSGPDESKNIYYKVSPTDISRAHKDNKAPILTVDKMTKVNDRQAKCITEIINENADGVVSLCEMLTTDERFKMTKTNENQYLYFAAEPTTITANCPSAEPSKHTPDITEIINGFGKFTAPETCHISAQKYQFFGKPIKISQYQANNPRIQIARFTKFRTLNLTIWYKILNSQNKLINLKANEIADEIIRVAATFNPNKTERVSKELREHLQLSIGEATIADSQAWKAIKRITQDPNYLPAILILISFIIIIMILGTLCRCMCVALCSNKSYTKMKQSQRSHSHINKDNKEENDEYLEVLHKGNDQVLSNIITNTLKEAETDESTFSYEKQFDHCMEQSTF